MCQRLIPMEPDPNLTTWWADIWKSITSGLFDQPWHDNGNCYIKNVYMKYKQMFPYLAMFSQIGQGWNDGVCPNVVDSKLRDVFQM